MVRGVTGLGLPALTELAGALTPSMRREDRVEPAVEVVHRAQSGCEIQAVAVAPW